MGVFSSWAYSVLNSACDSTLACQTVPPFRTAEKQSTWFAPRHTDTQCMLAIYYRQNMSIERSLSYEVVVI